jgi:hypothetical protein
MVMTNVVAAASRSARLPFLITAILFSQLSACQAHAAADKNNPTPVLVELFTSEGCSDCPPADALLARLDSSQFVPGAYAIVLSEHVTYWNHLGWRDPFSLDEMDARQQEYSARFRLNSVYTPQMVVDGAEQFVGSDRNSLERAIQGFAARQKIPVEIVEPRLQNGKATFSLRSSAANGLRWYAAIAADATRSEVSRGENAGRTLHHTAVVRVLKQLKRNADTQEFSLPAGAEATSSPGVRLVVFAVDAHTGRVAAAAQSIINR